LEATVQMKDVLKCFITTSGEQCVIMDSLTQQQQLFVTCLDSGKAECRLVVAKLTRSSSEDEIANVNFFTTTWYTYILQSTIDSHIAVFTVYRKPSITTRQQAA